MNWSNYNIEIPYGRKGGQVKTYCPQCRDRRTHKNDRSLSCDLSTGMFHCHYCGWSGCVADNNKDDWKFRNPQPMRNHRKEYVKPNKVGNSTLSDKLLAWFECRGITEPTLSAMKVTEGLEWMPQKNKVINTVQFNYYRNGELINTKFRTGDKCFKLVSGAELLPYNIDSIKGQSECIITEGEMDALSFIEAGFTSVVSVPNGANANLSYLDDYIDDYFEDKETIYIAVDTDSKGVELRDELMRRLGAERCRVLTYGDDCKDANEHLLKFGKASLIECLKSAPETKLEGVFSVSDFETSLDALFENGMQKGLLIGHENFDKYCSFETKRLCIVTGIPGSGKSEFIDEIAERLNMRYQWRFAFFSPENAPLAYHASKLIEKFTGKKFDKKHLNPGEYRQVKEHLEKDFFFISPASDFKLDTILDKAKSLVRRKGIKALVIDPYNRLESQATGRMSETLYISETLDKLTAFAQRYDLMIILMAHPTKLPKNKDGKIEAPTLYDISGSANFFNKADFGIVVHRDRDNNIVEVHIQKVKFRHLGEPGLALFKYNINNGRYVPYNGGFAIDWDNSNHLHEESKRQAEEMEESSRFDFLNIDPRSPFDDECPF